LPPTPGVGTDRTPGLYSQTNEYGEIEYAGLPINHIVLLCGSRGFVSVPCPSLPVSSTGSAGD
jgi:hypothetical protein